MNADEGSASTECRFALRLSATSRYALRDRVRTAIMGARFVSGAFPTMRAGPIARPFPPAFAKMVRRNAMADRNGYPPVQKGSVTRARSTSSARRCATTSSRRAPPPRLVMARQLLRLGVDVIEAGSPISSPERFRACAASPSWLVTKRRAPLRARSRRTSTRPPTRCATRRPRIHTGLGVSPSHLRDKLRMTEEECLERRVRRVRQEVLRRRAVRRGRRPLRLRLPRARHPVRHRQQHRRQHPRRPATRCPTSSAAASVPDGQRRRHRERHAVGALPQRPRHGDRRSLAGVRNGATQVECTINGLGEREGNTAMEEVVMAIRMHGDELDAHTDINTREFMKAGRLLTSITGMGVQANKAIVGANAFAHSSGIHQDGVLEARHLRDHRSGRGGRRSKPDRADRAQQPSRRSSIAWRSSATSSRARTSTRSTRRSSILLTRRVYDEDLEP